MPDLLRALRRAWFLLVIATSTPASAADPITGARFDSLSEGAVDVMRLHQGTMKAQMDRDEVSRVYEASIRSMKGDFVDRDGNLVRSDLARFLHTNWFGAGEPRTERAWFAGMQIDAAIIGSGQLSALPYNAEAILFGGYASRGWQASLGLRGEHHQGVYRDGSFVEGLSVPSTNDPTDRGGGGLILSVQQAEGAAFGAVLDAQGLQVDADRRDVLSALRTLFQPEAAMERADLRKLGVPSLAIERLAGSVDPWAERDPGDAPGPALWQLPIAMDDIGGLGLRVRVVPEIAPEPGLRLAEGSFTYLGKVLVLGARGGAWRSRGSFEAAADGFVTVVCDRRDNGDEGFAISLSAAHNVPDAATFFLIPDATVFGLGFTVGPLDMTRSSVPILASQKNFGRDR